MDLLTGQGSTGLHTLLPTAPAETGEPKLLHHHHIHHFNWDSKGSWRLLASLAPLLASPEALSFPHTMVAGL